MDQVLQALRVAVCLISRYWAVSILGPTRYVHLELGGVLIVSVTMLTFVEFGRGTAPFSVFALISGWMGCILLDVISAVGIHVLRWY